MGKGETNDNGSAIVFHINGQKHSVGANSKDVDGRTMLVDYIRDVANLKGTKVMCREGGCGACTVTAQVIDPATGAEVTKSVNSCLTPVLSCDGWDISTVERLGNKNEGYSVIQKRLVNFYGTQCGFCTPGMVMNMHSLLGSKAGYLEMVDIEKNLDGNICRCTGYRPILDAFKSFAADAPSELRQRCGDIEDCGSCPLKKSGQGSCAKASTQTAIKFPFGEEWITAKTLEDALTAAVQSSGEYRFVAGNTSTGIFKNEGPYKVYIDVNGIPELKKTGVDSNGITLGGGTTLTAAINLLKDASKKSGFEYGRRVATHLERVANVSVRNNGTLAGNLIIKHAHQDFPSDIFVLLEALGATLTIATLKPKSEKLDAPFTMSMTDFLKADMGARLIISINLPKREGYHFRSFKITRRYQNAHAYVNAGLLFKVNKGNNFTVEEKPRIVYGGISKIFHHASATEENLVGKSLGDESTLKGAFQTLEAEVKPEAGPLEASHNYRIQLTKTLLYKTILEIVGDKIGEKSRISGAGDLERWLITGKQVLEEDPTDGALFKSVPKVEARIQASGEAEYIGDIPFRPDELFGTFVQSTVAVARIKNIDASDALKVPGVVRFVSAKDIPGDNDFMKFNFWPVKFVEPVFAFDKVSFHGQPLGLILATSKAASVKASTLVKVTYEDITKPVINMKEAIEKAQTAGTFPAQTFGTFSTKPDEAVKVTHELKGTLNFGSQYHFYMETQSCVCHPREDGIDVYASTQWMDFTQNTVATVLNLPSNSVNVQVRRLGGGFGGKVSSSTLVACACAVASWVTQRPVRVILDLETNMSMLGMRLPYEIPYEVGFDDDGRIGKLKTDLICDVGWAANEPTCYTAMFHLQNVYNPIGWEVGTHFVVTNTPSNTYCRAPGSVQAVGAIEWIMDHVANFLKKDPISVREVNFLKAGDQMLNGTPPYERENMIPAMLAKLKNETDYDDRVKGVEGFNKVNRWKKRGLGVTPVRYEMGYWRNDLPVTIAIYHMDGHVAVSHGGIEMGQGLNTKVVQTVAQGLGIPMDRIKVKATNNFVAANAFVTGGSATSELVCYSTMKACEQLRENLKPILEKMEDPSWDKLIAEAYTAKVKLSAEYTPTAKDDLKGYDVWLLNATEVEIDVLTGEYKIIRTDLYEDTGKSLSPGVDLGQIEGGYLHGQGFWTTEKVIHDEQTGKLLTNGTWDYKVPEARDLPEDFRITLLSNTPNANGVLRSKATGEPSTDSAFAAVLAMRNAIASARADVGNTDWFEMTCPVSPEDIARLCLTKDAHLGL